MVYRILGKMRVFTCPSIPEPGAYLHLSDTGATKWQDPARKAYVRRRSGGIDIGDAGRLYIWIRWMLLGGGGDGTFELIEIS